MKFFDHKAVQQKHNSVKYCWNTGYPWKICHTDDGINISEAQDIIDKSEFSNFEYIYKINGGDSDTSSGQSFSDYYECVGDADKEYDNDDVCDEFWDIIVDRNTELKRMYSEIQRKITNKLWKKNRW